MCPSPLLPQVCALHRLLEFPQWGKLQLVTLTAGSIRYPAFLHPPTSPVLYWCLVSVPPPKWTACNWILVLGSISGASLSFFTLRWQHLGLQHHFSKCNSTNISGTDNVPEAADSAEISCSPFFCRVFHTPRRGEHSSDVDARRMGEGLVNVTATQSGSGHLREEASEEANMLYGGLTRGVPTVLHPLHHCPCPCSL